MTRLNIDAAIAALRRGFMPWECVVEVSGFEKTLQCQIVDIGGQPVIGPFWLALTDVVDPMKLRGSIEQMRVQVEKAGFALAPWNPRW